MALISPSPHPFSCCDFSPQGRLGLERKVMDLGGYHKALFEVFYHSIVRELFCETCIRDLLSVEVRSARTPPLLNRSSTLDRSKTKG